MSITTTFPHWLLFCLVCLLVRSPFVSGVKFNEMTENPTVEFGAAVGTYVTTVTAWKTKEAETKSVPITYRIFNSPDASYFLIDPRSGKITTQKVIDKKPSGVYKIILEANSGINADKQMIYINVTQAKNLFRPQFLQDSYNATLYLDTPIGAALLQTLAEDNDTNSEVRYSIESIPGVSDPSVASFQIDPVNGTITIKEPVRIGTKNVTFVVVARDSGVPPKESRVTVSVDVNHISEPRSVRVMNVLATAATVCWQRPETGDPRNFTLRYFEVTNSTEEVEMREKGFAVLGKTDRSKTSDWESLTATTVNPKEESLSFLCGNLTGLKPSTSYSFQVFGYKGKEIGRPSSFLTFTTNDVCSSVNCNNGSCVPSASDPAGYSCLCAEGFSGSHCQLKNPCLDNPCLNSGECAANGTEYTCTCPAGFKGSNCDVRDPCNAEANPCLNGGLCIPNSEDFHCECRKGFQGKMCESFDPCSLEPCMNQGTCSRFSDSEFTCHCSKGFTGSNCSEIEDPCRMKPCLNGGECLPAGTGNYSCVCRKGFLGSNCEVEDVKPDPCGSSPCLNNAVCQNEGESFICHCRPGFQGTLCENDTDECVLNFCQNGGTCTDKLNDFDCRCAPGFSGPICQNHEHCPDDIVITSKGKFHWPSIPHGETVQLSCPHGTVSPGSVKQRLSPSLNFDLKSVKKRSAQQHSKNPSRRHGALKDAEFRKQFPAGGSWPDIRRLNTEERMKYGFNGELYAVRSCQVLPNGTLVWMQQDDSLCRDEEAAKAEELSTQLENLTDSWTTVNAEEIDKVTQQIENLVEYAVKDSRVAQSMMNVLSNMLNIEDDVLDAGKASETMLDVIDRFTQSVTLKQNQTLTLTTPNIAIETTLLSPPEGSSTSQDYSYTFRPQFGPQRSRRTSIDPGNPTLDKQVSINIPKEAMDLAAKREGSVRLQFVSFRTSKLFRTEESLRGKPGLVLTATLGTTPISQLKQPVTYALPFGENSTYYSCVYWDEKRKTWSTAGMNTNITAEGILCSSDHLTAFSVLFDPSPLISVSLIHRRIMSIISYVGSACSVIGLTIAVFIYSLFRHLRRDRGGKILLNLCLSLLLLNIAYLSSAAAAGGRPDPETLKPSFSSADGRVWVPGVGGPQLSDAGPFCVGSAVAVHYLVLSSLAWMLVEAIHMYRLLITVFARSESYFTIKRILAAWGGPLLIVLLVVNFGLDYYNDTETQHCRLSPSYPLVYYLTFVGPICLMLLLNCIVFVMVMRVILQQGRQGKAVGKVGCTGSNRLVTAAQVRGALTVMALLGTSWVFGALAIGEARTVMQYLFCITSSFQGFIIFIVRVVFYPEARLACLGFLRTGKIKSRYEGTRSSTGPTTHSSTGSHLPVRSTMSSSTNSGSHNRRNPAPRSIEACSLNDTPTLPADARSWPQVQSSMLVTAPETVSPKKQGSFRKSFCRIFNQLRLEPSLLKTRELGPHGLLERHVSGATNPPPSPGEKPHQLITETAEIEDLAKPNFAIGEEITLLGSHEGIGYLPADDNIEECDTKVPDPSAKNETDPDIPVLTKRLSGLSFLGNETTSRRSSVAKEGTNTSWTFLSSDNVLGPAENNPRPRCRSIPVLNSGIPNSLANRRTTSAQQLLPRILPKPEGKETVKEKKNSCPATSSYHDLLNRNDSSFLEKKSTSVSESDVTKSTENDSFVMIAGRRVTVSRSSSKVEN